MNSPPAQVFVSLGKTVAQITAELAPIPGLLPLAEVLCGIIQLCENVTHNRNAARQLRDRCHSLVLAFRDFEEKGVGVAITQARNAVYDRLLDVQIQMSAWTQLGKIKSFIHQEEIARDIQRCNSEISDCVSNFNLASHFEIQEWIQDFTAASRRDHDEYIESLSRIQSSQTVLVEKSTETNDLVRQMMTLLQTAMGENKENAERKHRGLSSSLHQLQTQYHELLPSFHLQSGEVKKVGIHPVRGTATMDIYEGLYLEKEKVTIKAIRTVKFDEQSKRRFTREANLWGDIWKRDRGRHIVPFYGFCQIDGPFPCMVSPWLKNGDAVSYARANDRSLNYLRFIRHLASGVEVLHSMSLVHGDIRGSNILVSDEGLPLISDFGLSKIIHDVSGAPLTQSSVMADSCRYFAPEAFAEDGHLSPATDIYSTAMAILELFTHSQPYEDVKHHFEAGRRACSGIHPTKPSDLKVVRRGLDDSVWELLLNCWSLEPSERPTIQAFLHRLPASL